MLRTATALAVLASLLMVAPLSSMPTMMISGTTILDIEKVAPGFVLVGGRDGVARLIAARGGIVHEWRPPPGFALGYPRPLQPGHILVGLDDQQAGTHAIVEFDRAANVVWYFAEPEGVKFHHDYTRLENGNYLLLCSKEILRPEISDKLLTDDCLMEVTPDGEVVWEWQTADHFAEFSFDQERLDGIAEKGGDWAHANAAAPIPSGTSHTDPRFAPGNIVMSYRRISTVAVVDRVSGQIVWASEPGIGQHDSKMLPDSLPGGGHILLFDNGFGEKYSSAKRAREYSRVVEIDPLTNETVWEYTAESSMLPRWHFFSWFISSAQRLPNGNTLIDEGGCGRIFEVTAEGEIVWEFIADWLGPAGRDPDDPIRSNRIYRATKVPLWWIQP